MAEPAAGIVPIMLGERASAKSRCPMTGRSIQVDVDPAAVLSVDPEQAVVSQLGGCRVADVRGDVCDHGHFFAFPAAARDWVSRHPDGCVLTVRGGFERPRRPCEALGSLAAVGARQ